MINYLKLFYLSFVFLSIYGCDSTSSESPVISDGISWHRNSDGIFYGKTCIDKKLFVVSSTPHNRYSLSGVIGSCIGNEPFNDKPAPDIEENFIWHKSLSGVVYFYTCIEDHLFTVSPGSYHTRILSLIGNDCSSVIK